LILDVATILDIFRLAMKNDLAVCADHRIGEQWVTISTRDFYQRTVNTARALLQSGLRPGERTAIISENRYEWAVADYATLLAGGVDVPVYPTLTPEQMAFVLRDCGARIAIVSTRDQLEKVLSIRSQTSLDHILVMDDLQHPNATQMSQLMLSRPYAPDPEMDERARSARPDQLATIIYTSGTTGVPKGVMLTHGNIASNIAGSSRRLEWSTGQGFVSFLPLSHITARHVDYTIFAHGITITYCPNFEDLSRCLMHAHPHNFVAVPRVYEKIRQEAERRAGSGLRKKIFDWAMGVGRRNRAQILAGRTPAGLSWKLADALVFSRIRHGMGGNPERCISGGAPLPLQVAEWFADVGIRIYEGYGLTETSPVIAVNSLSDYKIGTVGKPLRNIEVRIADDGELLVRGPSVTQGYWNLPEETANAFADGWFQTGDIAELDSDGFLKITDRKKDLIKTSGGKFIAPQPIENTLKANVLVAHAAVIGDKRKFPSVLIAPNFPLLREWAQAQGLPDLSNEELVRNEKVMALYEEIVQQANSARARFEQLKRVMLVPDEFTVASGELTPSLKLKRRAVEKKYAALIDAVYADAELHHPQTAETH
jgi:long-chain acyl-CoA synthetase